MALKPLNSVGGFSVGESPVDIILSNGDITTSNITLTANAAALNVLTNNLLYANGVPWVFGEPAAGTNTQIQFNTDGSFDASANFTFDKVTNQFTLVGNANVGNILANIATFTTIAGTLTTSAQPNITSVGTLSSLAVTGNVSAANFVGNLANGNSNIAITGNANITMYVNGNVTPRFIATSTGVNVAGTFNVSGNANVANIGAEYGVFTNVSGNGSNLTSLTGANVTGFVPNANVANTAYSVSVGNVQGIGNIATLNIDGSSSNILYGNGTFAPIATATGIANGTSNINIPAVNGNVNTSVGGTANVLVVTQTGVNVAGTLNSSGNLTVGNANLGNLAIANSIQTANIVNGNSNVTIAANGNVTISATGTANVISVSTSGLEVIGNISANGEGSFGTVETISVTSPAGNVTIASQQSGNSYVELKPFGTLGAVDVSNFRIQSLAEPVNSSDAATKAYVDSVAEGLHIHESVAAATPNTLAVITGGTITYNNGTSGVGANLVTTGSFTLIDTVNIATVGTRILVKNEANAAHNGIYTYANSTTIVRATDYDTAAEIDSGDFVFVTGGSTYDNTGWVQINAVTTVGTDPITWEQFSGAGTYTGTNGITVSGTVISANVDNITTSISGGNIVVKTSAQLTTPNIDAATGTSLTVSGNVQGANLIANTKVTTVSLDASGNILAGNIASNANVLTNNLTVNLAFSGNTANLTGNLTAANANLGNLVVANFFTGTLINGTSNIVVNNNGNIVSTAAGNATLTVTGTGANITGYANVTGNISAGNISAVANVSANNVSVTSNLIIGTDTRISSGNVTTISLTANQTIAQLPVSGITGVEFFVKGTEAAGARYTVATIQAVTNGSVVDYSTFGRVSIGTNIGTFAVNVNGGNIALQVTPATTNSIVWTTQFRTI